MLTKVTIGMIGHGAWGMGHWALGNGHWAWGIGQWGIGALGIKKGQMTLDS
jgi:hypothetical protein